eukprot:GEMP01078416.1.p1 GENE.GEMP01078416.1~~GEMP01078416.1.p1  ORF type:complete len:133 (+),score=27.82 GEMP01078416.1:213-611(+)
MAERSERRARRRSEEEKEHKVLKQSMRRFLRMREVSKKDLIDRNILVGISIVRRAKRLLERSLGARKTFAVMVDEGRLPADYIDRLFPKVTPWYVEPSLEDGDELTNAWTNECDTPFLRLIRSFIQNQQTKL